MATDRLMNHTQGESIVSALQTIAQKSETPYNASNKLPTDFADDTNQTNKFATQAELDQIQLNKNNISWNTQNGVKNLFNLTKASETYSTVIFTVNSDKTVTVNGTASPANSVFNLDDWTCTKAGTYVVSGAPSGGSWAPSPNTYRIRVAVNGAWKGDDVGNGFALALAVGDVINLQINTSTSYTANNLIFKPMICLKSIYDADPTYEPYALSNAELTAKEQVNENNILSLAANTVAKGNRYVANQAKTYTLEGSYTYLITVISYNVAGMFLALKYNNETSPRLFPVYKAASFDNSLTVASIADSSDISITPTSSNIWFISNIATL